MKFGAVKSPSDINFVGVAISVFQIRDVPIIGVKIIILFEHIKCQRKP
jgi:hypothetical protein